MLSQYKKVVTLILFLILSLNGIAQSQLNSDVAAKIQLNSNNEFITITATAFNKTEINKSLRYKLSAIKTNPETNNTSTNNQSSRFVLKPNEKIKLASTTLNTADKNRIIILLLIYDTNNQIVGKDRVVINDTAEDNINAKQKLLAALQALDKKDGVKVKTKANNSNAKSDAIESKDVDTKARDGIEIKGIVVEDTKTKPGRDFYKLFYDLYSTNQINGNKIVTIKEVLALGSNTKIEVIVGDKIIFGFFVNPRGNYLLRMNDIAIQKVYNHFKRLEKESKTIKRY